MRRRIIPITYDERSQSRGEPTQLAHQLSGLLRQHDVLAGPDLDRLALPRHLARSVRVGHDGHALRQPRALADAPSRPITLGVRAQFLSQSCYLFAQTLDLSGPGYFRAPVLRVAPDEEGGERRRHVAEDGEAVEREQ